jgi:hypothetical protein
MQKSNAQLPQLPGAQSSVLRYDPQAMIEYEEVLELDAHLETPQALAAPKPQVTEQIVYKNRYLVQSDANAMLQVAMGYCIVLGGTLGLFLMTVGLYWVSAQTQRSPRVQPQQYEVSR